MRKGTVIAFAIALLVWAGPVRAGGSAGGETFQFLNLDVDARAVGLGGAYSAIATDANALHYNPAGLAAIDLHRVVFLHNQHIAGLSQQYAAYASPMGWGLNINRLGSEGVPRTTISNPNGDGLGQATYSDLSIGAGYGHRLNDSFAVGFGLKFLDGNIDNTHANGYALDLGAILRVKRTADRLRFGFAIQNMGPAVTYQKAEENLPLLFRFASAYEFDLLNGENTVVAELDKGRTEKIIFKLGVERIIGRVMALRFGYDGRNDAGPGFTLGTGFRTGDLSFDYAFVPFGDLGTGHRASIAFAWGGSMMKKKEAALLPPIRQVAEGDRSNESVEALFAVADKAMEEERFPDAHKALVDAFSQFTADDKRRVFFFSRLGYLNLIQGQIGAAAFAYEEAVWTATQFGAPSSVVANVYRGFARCRSIQGRRPEARALLRKALEASLDQKMEATIRADLAELEAAR